jgi:hypothetical protein
VAYRLNYESEHIKKGKFMGNKDTFASVFKGGGNLAEFNFDWWCENCKKKLKFQIVVEDMEDVEWVAPCCGSIYKITPYVAVYNKIKIE